MVCHRNCVTEIEWSVTEIITSGSGAKADIGFLKREREGLVARSVLKNIDINSIYIDISEYAKNKGTLKRDQIGFSFFARCHSGHAWL